MSTCNNIYKLIPEHQFVVGTYLLRCRLQKGPHLLKKKKKKKKKKLLTLNPKHMFLFGPTKHAKKIEKVAELTFAELTQGRESTRLPHTHKFTSLKSVVISVLHKIDKWIHIQA